MELYCNTCEELVCSHCVFRGQAHQSHDYQVLDSNFQRHRDEIDMSFQVTEEKLDRISNVLSKLETQHKMVLKQQEAIEGDIVDSVDRLQEVLRIRRAELLQRVQSTAREKLELIEARRRQVATSQAELSSGLEAMRNGLRASSEVKVLAKKRAILKQTQELASISVPDSLAGTEADIEFLALSEARTACESFGKIYTQASPDPAHCRVIVADTVTVREELAVTLLAADFSGEPCLQNIEHQLHCTLVSEIAGTTSQGTAKRMENDKYRISFQPVAKGPHRLRVSINDTPVQGSPQLVVIRLLPEWLSRPLLSIGGIMGPRGIAFGRTGELVITEYHSHCVSILSPGGERLRSFGTDGSGEGELHYPHGLTVDGEGNIAVADSDNHRIQKFTSEGKFVAQVGTKGEATARGSNTPQFFHPADVAYNASNRKLYVVDANCHVQVLNPDLSVFATFGKRGSHRGQLSNPLGVACDSSGNVYVADTNNNRVQVFTAEGHFLRTIRDQDVKNSRPMGVAIDASDLVYVAQMGGRCISVFTPEGKLVTSFGAGVDGESELSLPTKLAVNKECGLVYVCDFGNNRIQAF